MRIWAEQLDGMTVFVPSLWYEGFRLKGRLVLGWLQWAVILEWRR